MGKLVNEIVGSTDRTVDEASAPRRSLGARWGPLIAYACPYFSISLFMMPVAVLAPNLFVKERNVALAAIGTVLVAARIFDAVSDQAVGYLSDATRRWLPGGRKAWLVMGTIVAVPSIYMLFTPPATAGLGWFTTWSLISYFAWSLLIVPYQAWGAELSRDYNERTRIATTRSVMGQAGTMLFLAVPLALKALGLAPTSEMTLQATHVVALGLIVLLPATILPALLFTPQGVHQSRPTPISLMSALRALKANGPMQIFLGAVLISELGYGIVATVFFLYIDAYLGLGDKFSPVIMVVNIATLASLPFWEWWAQRTGKRSALMLSWGVQAVTLAGLAFVPRGAPGYLPLLALMAVNSFFVGASLGVSPSIVGDIVDYDTLKTGGYRAGSYFALFSLADKIVVAFGTGISFILLGWAGFDAIHPATNTRTANWAMLAIFALLPAALRLASLTLLARYPLTARRQAIVKRRLEQREARAARKIATEQTS